MKMSDFDGENWTEKFSQRNIKKKWNFLTTSGWCEKILIVEKRKKKVFTYMEKKQEMKSFYHLIELMKKSVKQKIQSNSS